MKKTITLLLICTLFLSVNAQRHNQRDSVVVAKETFSGFVGQSFDTDFNLWQRLNGWNSGNANPPWSYPYTIIADSGVFTTNNGWWAGGNSDSSMRIITYNYGGIDDMAQTWPDSSSNKVLIMAQPFRYAGSWDTTFWNDIDIEDVIDLAIEFHIVRRSNASNPSVDTSISGFRILVSIDDGPWTMLTDTVDYAGSVYAGRWVTAIVDLDTSMHGSSMDICFANGLKNQNILSDISITGWADIITINDFTITAAGGATTITSDGGTLQMSAAFAPSDAKDTTFVWSVVNGTGIATINDDGLLTADCNGTVNVTATANDFGAYSETYTVTLSNQTELVNQIIVTAGTPAADGTVQMSANALPACANDLSVTWSVDDETIGTISATGLVTPVSDGLIEVTATNAASGITGSTDVLLEVGINNIAAANISMYPNPVQNTLTLDNASMVQRVQVLSLNGATLVEEYNANSETKLEINTSSLSTGMYIVKVYTNNGIYTSKLAK